MTIPVFMFASVALLVLSIVGLVWSTVRGKARARQLDALADAQFKKWRNALESADGYLPAVRLPINLQRGETGYFYATSVTLCEPRAVRSGSYGGGSVRVMKGVSIHSGRFASESHDEWRPITTGNLYVTDRRIVFDGQMKNRIIKLDEVMSVSTGYREVCVNSSKLQKPIGFKDVNGQIFAAVVNALSGGDE